MKRLNRLLVRREEETELHATRVRLMRNQVDGVRRTAIYDGNVGLYQSWYLELRLSEEMERARRYNMSFAVFVVRLNDLALSEIADEAWQAEAASAAYITARSVRAFDLSASVGPMEFAVCLLHCHRAGAIKAIERLRAALDRDCSIGLTMYPDDNVDSRSLIELARSRSRDEKPVREVSPVS